MPQQASWTTTLRTPRLSSPGARLAAVGVVLVVMVAALAQILPHAGADTSAWRVRDGVGDAGAVDLDHNGVADVAQYGATNASLSVGEQPSDGSDLRLFLPFRLPRAAIDAAKAGGTATVAMRVRRVEDLAGRKLVIDGYTVGNIASLWGFNRPTTHIATVTPVAGRLGVDVTDLVRSMTGRRMALRLRLDQAAPLDGRLTQVNLATRESPTEANRPVLTVTAPITASRPPPTTVPTTTPTTTPPPPPTTPITAAEPTGPPTDTSGNAQPPATVTGGQRWDVMFNDDFDNAAKTAANWDTGMRSGALTIEANTELTWYKPQNSTVTTDRDGSRDVSVLQQRMTRETVPGEYYSVRTLCRLYPPAQYPQYYNPAVDNTCNEDNTAKTKVQYQFTSGLVNNAKSFAFKYGYLEARVKMPKGFAMWPALWLRDWQPWSYEVDVMEGFDRDARTYRSTYWWGNAQHYSMENNAEGDVGLLNSGGPCHAYVPIQPTSSSPGTCSLANSVDLSAGYHTVGLNWTPTKYEFYLDGQKVWESLPGADVDHAFQHMILSLGFGNSKWEFDWTKEQVKPLEAQLGGPNFPKPSIEWDYVRVWQSPAAHDVCTTGSCPG